jgi:glycosyltransferase involved in cell wall biosynthesis
LYTAQRFAWALSVFPHALGVAGREPFEAEDAILAPAYSPILLRTRKPFAVTLHDLLEFRNPEHVGAVRRHWRRYINQQLSRRSALIVCEADYVRRDIVRLLHVAEQKVRVIVAPPLLAQRASDATERAAEVRAKYALPEQMLFYPAQFWAHKNHLRLIEAFARIAGDFPACGLVLTGRKHALYRRVYEAIERHGLADRVRYLGHVDQAEFPALYDVATALVMPSLFESVSIPIYEAFQAGVPVCASSLPGICEQVGDAAILFDPTSVESIANSMRVLLADADLRAVLARRGEERLAENSYARYTSRLQVLVDDLVSTDIPTVRAWTGAR